MRNDRVLASADPAAGGPARAEEILSVIRSIVKGAGLTLADLAAIAVSTGPGSYSGTRIGIATAKGLSRALSIDLRGVSVLDAMALAAEGSNEVTTAVVVGKKQVAWLSFRLADGPRPLFEPILQSDSDFLSTMRSSSTSILLCQADLRARLGDHMPPGIEIVEVMPTLAELIGRFAERYPARTSITPIYLRDQRAAAGI